MKYIYAPFLIVCFSLCQVNIFGNTIIADEVLNLKTSSVFLVENDSIIDLKYNEVLKIYQNKNYVLALEKALKLNSELKNNYWNYKFTTLIADIYDRTNKFSESLKYYKNSLEFLNLYLLDKGNSKFSDEDYANTLLRVGSSYHKLSVSKEEEEVNRPYYLDSAKIYYRKLEDLSSFNPEIDNIKASAFSNLSGIFEIDSVFDKAENYVRKAIDIHRKNNNSLSTSTALNNLGNIFLSQKKYEESKEIYLEALELIKNNNDSNTFRIKASLYFNLAWAMRNLKEYEAYDFQEKSYQIEGNIRDKEFRGIIEEVTSKYDFDSKKALFEKQAENKRLKAANAFWIFGIFAILIILTLVYWLNLFKLKQKNLGLKLEQTELLQNQHIEKLKSETQARILNATIDGKESERKDIAETLHDSVSSLLSSANLHLQASRKHFNGNVPEEINKTQTIILDASEKIRDLSHTLIPSVLLKFGLNFSIKDIAEKFSNSEIEIDTQITDLRRYHQKFEIKIYNIILELVNNVIKHSKAETAFINLKDENSHLIIEIMDDGAGFDKTKINNEKGLGINQIEARVLMMQGVFKIESSKNNGTKIYIKVPVVAKEEFNHE